MRVQMNQATVITMIVVVVVVVGIVIVQCVCRGNDGARLIHVMYNVLLLLLLVVM